jgi:hypothetical protein
MMIVNDVIRTNTPVFRRTLFRIRLQSRPCRPIRKGTLQSGFRLRNRTAAGWIEFCRAGWTATAGVEGSGVASAGGHQILDLVNRSNAAAGSRSRAVEGRRSAGKVESLLQTPFVKESVDEARMEDVAGAGGVEDVDPKRRPVAEGPFDTGENAIVAKGGSREKAAEASLDLHKSLKQIGLAGEAARDVAADNEVVDFFDQALDARIKFVEISDNRDACFSRPGGCGDGCRGVVSVEMDGARVGDPFLVEIVGQEREAIVALPQDGSLAGVFDEDERLLARAGRGSNDSGFYTGFAEFPGMEGGGIVVAEFADVTRAEAPKLTGDHGRGDLPAGQDGGGADLNLGAGSGILRNGDQGIGGVEADAHNVDWHRCLFQGLMTL